MSGQDNKLKVIIAIHKASEESIEAAKSQTYPNVELVIDYASSGRTAPNFFNDIITNQDADIYGMIDGYCLLNKNCVEEIVKRFLTNEEQIVGACYTDYKLIQDNIDSNQYYHSYDIDFLKRNIINPYIFINGKIITKIFDEELESIYYYDALTKISLNAMIYHIPKCLLRAYNNPVDIQNDIKRLNINVNRS